MDMGEAEVTGTFGVGKESDSELDERWMKMGRAGEGVADER